MTKINKAKMWDNVHDAPEAIYCYFHQLFSLVWTKYCSLSLYRRRKVEEKERVDENIDIENIVSVQLMERKRRDPGY